MMSREPLVTLPPQQTEDGIPAASLSHTTEPCLSHSEVTKDADATGVDPIQDEEVLGVVQHHVTQHQQVPSIVQKPLPRGRELTCAIHDSTHVQKAFNHHPVWCQEHGQDCQQCSHQRNQNSRPPMDQSSTRDHDLVGPQEEGCEAFFLGLCMPFTATQGLTSGAACEDDAWEAGGHVITQADEPRRPPLAQPEQILLPPAPNPPTQRHAADLATPVPAALLSTGPGPGSNDEGDIMACSDLMSLRSDTVSLASEPAFSRKSGEGLQEDDNTSVATSSVTSSFHRVQMDPVEKAWLRSSVLGDNVAQRQLLTQDPGLALKKTALHWAAKQGRLGAVDMMLHAGANVNVRTGYTALHLASIHGHAHVVQALVNTYSAKTYVRDYHGKKAAHYWSGNTDVFNKPEFQSGETTLSCGRRTTQRYSLASFSLSRSRSHGQLNPELRKMPLSPSLHGTFDLHM